VLLPWALRRSTISHASSQLSVSPNVPSVDHQLVILAIAQSFGKDSLNHAGSGIGVPGVFLILTRSRTGLRSSNSSTTYPVIVRSENLTIIPSTPSNSTDSIWISVANEILLHGEEWLAVQYCSQGGRPDPTSQLSASPIVPSAHHRFASVRLHSYCGVFVSLL
jgi:hypothetical protein